LAVGKTKSASLRIPSMGLRWTKYLRPCLCRDRLSPSSQAVSRLRWRDIRRLTASLDAEGITPYTRALDWRQSCF
jgi:hypothetical protein